MTDNTNPPGTRGADRAPLPPIKFTALADALLAQAETLVPMWLPGGVRRGPEYVCGSLSGGEGGSCSVNMVTGAWADFAGDDKGKDLVSLYASIHELSMGKAARLVAQENGLEDVAGVQHVRGGTPALVAPPPPPPPPVATSHKPESEGWTPVWPVPSIAPTATFKHFDRKPEAIAHVAEYRVGEELHGYVVRFTTSTGGKDTLPYTWCTSARDGGAKWCWKQWDEPRPLYLPARTMPGKLGTVPLLTVVLVEGEKKADTLQALLDAFAPGVYLVVSWSGGCKAWKKASWHWLAGCTVLLWPDCDAKREPLNKAERAAYIDPLARKVAEQDKPLLPAFKQPGLAAMLGIGYALREQQGCTVQLLPIPAPGAVVDGWDCGDAITTDGWDGAAVLAFFARAHALPAGGDDSAPLDAVPAGAGEGGRVPPTFEKIVSPGEPDDGDDAFREHLDFIVASLKLKGRWELGVNRKLLIAAWRKAPALKGCLVFDQLADAPATVEPFPWRNEVGPLVDRDDLASGDWLSTKYGLGGASRTALAEAMETVYDERRYHPIRDGLKQLTHDGKPRMDKWLIYILGLDPDKLPAKHRHYLELMGRFILIGLVARVMKPGCKFDYSPVFEGLTGVGKSTLVETLVGKLHFSDTQFDIGTGVAGMEQLRGIWGYEFSEMTNMRRSDGEQVKQFLSSTVDRFRGAYGRFVVAHPRQCVIFCTTNKRQYLYDLTGNRRFWPVWIDKPINLGWLEKYRDQLLAEAYALYQAGERYSPTREEEEIYFVPEQKKRLVQSAVQARMYDLLTREGAPPTEAKITVELNQYSTFVRIDQMVQALGTDAGKSSGMLEGQVTGWLQSMGWTHGRESTGQRRYGYKRPPVWPPVVDEDEFEGDAHAAVLPFDETTGSGQARPDQYGGDDDEPF